MQLDSLSNREMNVEEVALKQAEQERRASSRFERHDPAVQRSLGRDVGRGGMREVRDGFQGGVGIRSSALRADAGRDEG